MIYLGSLVRVGGRVGPVMRIVGFDPYEKVYHLVDIHCDKCEAWLGPEYFKKIKGDYYQLDLFETSYEEDK